MAVAVLALVGCGPKDEPKESLNEGFKVTVNTNEIIANNKKAAKFVATFDGKLLHEEQVQTYLDSTLVTLPEMKFVTTEVGEHNLYFTYEDNTSPLFTIKAIEPAPMSATVILIIFYLLSPAFVLWACNKWKILGKIGPVLILYFIGIIIANLNLIPEGCKGLQDTISTVAIPLALPMMLYSCNFKNFSIKTSLRITIIGVVSVAIATLVGFLSLRDGLGEEGAIVGGALMGKCTGGTPNLAALKVMLHMENSTFIIINSFDMIICFVYLVMLMTVGIKLGRKWLGRGIYTTDTQVNLDEYAEKNPYRDFGKKKSILQLLKVFATAAIIAVISLLVSNLFKEGTALYDILGGDFSMVALILTLTTISLLLTCFREVRSWDKSFDAGMYLIYIFCLAMAMLADLSQLNWKIGFWVLIYQTIIVFGSLLISVLLAKPFKVDADSAVITSDTLVNSPICVPMIAAAMKNKSAIMVGITNGLAGYAVGNYLGYLIYRLLCIL